MNKIVHTITAATLIAALENVPAEAQVELHPDPVGSVSLRGRAGDRLLLVAVDAEEPITIFEYPLDRIVS